VVLNARRVVRICGVLLSAAALVWIGIRFAQSNALGLLERLPIAPAQLALVLAGVAIAYSLALSLLAFAWSRLIAALSTTSPPARPIMATWAATQYGKYLPGNVAHYALRHAWSRRYGLSHAALALASILEAALLLLAALALTLLGDTRRLRILSLLDARVAIAVLVAMLASLGIALYVARRRTFAERWHVPALPTAPVLLFCLACYVAFFAACAGLIEALALALGIDIGSFAMLLAASAASWAAGFVVIGAPGGLGVREAAFVALAGGALGESRALLLIGLFRIVTFLGDTLFLAAGALALRGSGVENGHKDVLSRHRSAP
jgi:uncharacterized membrane protein YbhN (UPF0104 family)